MSGGAWLEEIRAEERDSIERARECVRRKDPAGALTHLALAPYVPRDIVAYVRGAWLPRARLERVLRWLTREELTTAREALDRGDYRAAKQACRAAWAIDRRGTLGATLTAMALLGQSGEAARRDPPAGPAELRDLLLQARTWVQAAAVDGSLRTDVRRLAALVDDRLAEIDRAERRRDERAVDDLVGRYNTLLDAYGRRITRTQAHNMRASLASLAVAVARSRERMPPDSAPGSRLVELARAIAYIQAQLASPV